MKFFKYILLSVLIAGCSSEVENSNSTEGYSKSELLELEHASGREIETLNQSIFKNLKSNNELLVFHFNDISSPDFYTILEKVEADFEGSARSDRRCRA